MPADPARLRAIQTADAELYAKLRRGWWPQRILERRELPDLRVVFRAPDAEVPR